MFLFDEQLADVLEEAHTRRSWWLEVLNERDEVMLRSAESSRVSLEELVAAA